LVAAGFSLRMETIAFLPLRNLKVATTSLRLRTAVFLSLRNLKVVAPSTLFPVIFHKVFGNVFIWVRLILLDSPDFQQDEFLLLVFPKASDE